MVINLNRGPFLNIPDKLHPGQYKVIRNLDWHGELPEIVSFTDFLKWNYTLEYGRHIRELHYYCQLPLPWGVPRDADIETVIIEDGRYDRIDHDSLSAQVSYYNNLIQSNPEWLFCGVYADEALTGTKDNRENFQRLLSECRAGRIDLIITKSISRFARNTVTLLETIRELKELGVDVYFEEQNIHSISPDGEFMLTLLGSYAQEESYSASENQKWRIRKDFEQGRLGSITMLGYERSNAGTLIIVPEEAEIVRMIFNDFLSGMGKNAIANKRLYSQSSGKV